MAKKREKSPEERWLSGEADSVKVGVKGINRVTLAVRPGRNAYEVTWFDNGRRERHPLTLPSGPILDRGEALRVIQNMAVRLRETVTARQKVTIQRLLGLPEVHTVKELFDEWVAAHPRWSPRHKHDSIRRASLWKDQLGEDTDISRVTPADVELIIDKIMEDEDWEPNTANRVLAAVKAAFNWGYTKKLWLDKNSMTAVDLFEADPEGAPYSTEEAYAIARVAHRVDPRLPGMVELALATGHRINAISKLKVEHLRYERASVDGEEITVMVVKFPGWEREKPAPGSRRRGRRVRRQKAGVTGEAVLEPRARAVIEALVQTPVVQGCGLLFPNRANLQTFKPTYSRESPTIRPISLETATHLLHKAEKLAGVAHVDRRAWHGFKRIAVTSLLSVTGNLDAVGRQANTTVEVLRTYYLQQDLSMQVEAALALGKLREKKDL